MKRRQSKKFTVLYDSKCAFCMKAWKNLKRLDKDDRLKGLSLHSSVAKKKFPHLKASELIKEIHISTPRGNVKKGADAFIAILPYLRKVSWLKNFTWIPLFKPISRFVYRSIAEHRTVISRFLK